jgi:hypothetical protein
MWRVPVKRDGGGIATASCGPDNRTQPPLECEVPHSAVADDSAAIDQVARKRLIFDIVDFGVSSLAVLGSVLLLGRIDRTQEVVLVSLLGGFGVVIAVTSAVSIARH